MPIKHLQQSEFSNQCGQACVAMILNVSIERAVELIQKKGSTQTKDIARVLNQNGFDCDLRLTRISKKHQIPDFCILKITFGNRHTGHWVLWNGKEETYHDPSFNYPAKQFGFDKALKYYNGRITSFLKIRTQGG